MTVRQFYQTQMIYIGEENQNYTFYRRIQERMVEALKRMSNGRKLSKTAYLLWYEKVLEIES